MLTFIYAINLPGWREQVQKIYILTTTASVTQESNYIIVSFFLSIGWGVVRNMRIL